MPVDSKFIAGFKPTAPTANQMQLVTPVLPTISAGQDVTFCSYLDFTAEKTLDVIGYKGFQSQGGRHTILYATSKRGTQYPCLQRQCIYNVHYIGGGGTDATIAEFDDPGGHRLPHPQGRAGDDALALDERHHQGRAGAGRLQHQRAGPTSDVDPGDLFTVVTTNFTLPVGEGKAHTECVVKQDFKFFMIGGAHEWRRGSPSRTRR